jgi:2-phosphosulfolactate phosphatase
LKIVHAGGLAGAAAAAGTVVVIDVIRAFSVSAYALAGGARECRLVAELDEARGLAEQVPGAVIAAEVDGLPVEGIPLSNSPTMVRELELKDRVLIQRTSAGTQCAVAAKTARRLFAGSLLVASATARAIRAEESDVVTLVATGDDRGHPEDRACAEYLEALLQGRRADLDRLLQPLYRTDRYAELAAGLWPGFPASDVELCLAADRFDFPMPIDRDQLGLTVSAPIS